MVTTQLSKRVKAVGVWQYNGHVGKS